MNPLRLLRSLFVDAYLRRLARNSGWLYAATVAGLLAGIAQTIVAARFLGAADYGRVALVTVSVGAVKQLLDVRTWEFVTRYLAEFTESERRGLALATLKIAVISEYGVATLAFATTLAASGLVAGRFLGDSDLQPLIALYAVTLLATALNGTATATLRVFDRFRDVALQSSGQALLRLALIAGALATGGGLTGVVIAYLASETAGGLALALLAARQVKGHLWQARTGATYEAVRPHLRGMFGFMAHTFARGTLKLGNRNLDILLLGHFQGPTEAGYYRAARSLGGAALQFTDPLYFAVFPEFARGWVAGRERFVAMVRRTAAVGVLLAVPGAVAGLLLAPVLFDVSVGAEYDAAVQPFRIIMLAIGIAAATFWATPAALGSGAPRIATIAFALGVAVQVALLLALTPDHGATGAAIALVGFYTAWAAAILWMLLARLRRPASNIPPVAAAPELDRGAPEI